jgi:hypothetical protein
MKVGDLVYSGHMLEIGHTVLGIVGAIQYRYGEGEPVFRVFWVDGGEPSWYYEHEVELVDENR